MKVDFSFYTHLKSGRETITELSYPLLRSNGPCNQYGQLLLQTDLSLHWTPVFARLYGRCNLMTSGCNDVHCLGKRASDASICSEDFKAEDLPLHQEEAYVDFGGRFTRTPEGGLLVVLRAELLTDKKGRVSTAAPCVMALGADALSQRLTACAALTLPCHSESGFV